MFDDKPIEVGKIELGYLTDEQGRRIYFPVFGPARLIPSRDAEAKLRERAFFSFVAAFLWLAVAYGLSIFWLRDILESFVADSLPLLSFAALAAAGSLWVELSAHRWETVPESEPSPGDYVVGVLLRQSLPTLWRMAILRLLGFLCVAALAALSILDPVFHWTTATALQWSLHLPLTFFILAMLPLVGRNWWHAARALGERLGQKSQA